MIVIIGGDQEQIVPNLVLCNFMLHRFPGKNQADASAVFYVLAGVVAVVHLKLQIRARRNP